MVWVRRNDRRRGRLGKLARDPAVLTAAVALLHGIDPIRMLNLPRSDWTFCCAVLAAAERLYVERRTAETRQLAVEIVNTLAQAMR